MRKLQKSLALIAVHMLLLAAAPPSPTMPSAGEGSVVTDAEKVDLAYPGDRSARLSMQLSGKRLNYVVTVGHLPVRDEVGVVIGEAVYTAYAVPSATKRPVTFAFNGGPGSSSTYLQYGGLGPQRINIDRGSGDPKNNDAPSDNPGTWLDLTDLVFIDPIGTGYSRSLLDEQKSVKEFYGVNQDAVYLSHLVYDWLVKHGRLQSQVYLVGESYAGFRIPRMVRVLQSDVGVRVRGISLVSPYLDNIILRGGMLETVPWAIELPSMAAAYMDKTGSFSQSRLEEVERYAKGEYTLDLLKGRSDPEAIGRIADKLSNYTGLSQDLIKREAGRIEKDVFLRELYRKEGRVGSRYDPTDTAFDPTPEKQNYLDVTEDLSDAEFTTALSDLVTRQVGWQTSLSYIGYNHEANRVWDRDTVTDKTMEDLRASMAADPDMRVLIGHGRNDLGSPYLATKMLLDQMPSTWPTDNIRLCIYPGSHMFYTKNQGLMQFRNDAAWLYDLAPVARLP